MKNIGLKLKDKREENGLSIEEVAEDLKMRPSQISSIEEGKTEDFKDVFYLILYKNLMNYKTFERKSFRRGFCGFAKNCCGSFSSTIFPSSINTTFEPTSRAKPIS